MSLTRKTSQLALRGFLFLNLLLIFISCASGSPTGSSSLTPVSFFNIEEVQPQWESFADGIDYFHGKTAAPQLEFWALRINLNSPQTRIVVRGGAAGSSVTASSENETLSTKVSSFVRDNELLAGINAAPFDVISSREGQPINNIGLVISEGRLISPVSRSYDALVFYKDGRAAIVRQSAINSDNIGNIENAVGGFHQVLANAEPMQRTLMENPPRHPRSAAGVSANGRILYLLVIDGRRGDSKGATEREVALLLRALGCHDGINFDGGGSSALAMRYGDGRVRVVNTPIHNGIPNSERAVAGSIGVGN